MAIVTPSKSSEYSAGPVLGFQGVTDQMLLESADSVLGSLERWGWPEYPERPETLQSDHELWTAYRKKEREEKLSKEDREQLQLLGTWRSRVLHIEMQMAAKLLTLLGCIRTLESAHQTDGQGRKSFHRMDDGDQLRQHVLRCFRLKLPEQCPDPVYLDTRRLCEYFTRNLQLVPDHLRRMVRPPAGEGWTRPEAPRQSGSSYSEEED